MAWANDASLTASLWLLGAFCCFLSAAILEHCRHIFVGEEQSSFARKSLLFFRGPLTIDSHETQNRAEERAVSPPARSRPVSIGAAIAGGNCDRKHTSMLNRGRGVVEPAAPLSSKSSNIQQSHQSVSFRTKKSKSWADEFLMRGERHSPCADVAREVSQQFGEPKREDITILYADVHRYCRLIEDDECSAIIRTQEAISDMALLVELNGGRVLETAGDGVLSVFCDALQAVNFSLIFKSRNFSWKFESEHRLPLRFRIGINSGATIIKNDRIHGHNVNVAARIQELAYEDGIVISHSTIERLDKIPRGTRIIPMGKKNIRNMNEKIRLYRLCLDNEMYNECGAGCDA